MQYKETITPGNKTVRVIPASGKLRGRKRIGQRSSGRPHLGGMLQREILAMDSDPYLEEGETIEMIPSLQVAAYCRVSTLLEEQESSYEAQIRHYTSYINAHPGWMLSGIYADEGLSGTQTAQRTEFNRMIEDCLCGKVDLVITKSISRFARNTLDCLKYIRLLKSHDIAIYFEKENINTLDAKGEVLITIMASLAQQESQSISQNVSMGIRYQYRQGKIRLNHTRFLGYTKDSDGQLVIVPEQAKIVRRIYQEFLDGKTPGKIAQGLTDDEILTVSGKYTWRESTVRSILKNEKYIGDALLQKEYTADYLTKKRVHNTGILPQYYVEDDHEAIISREEYQRVQEEFRRRSRDRYESQKEDESVVYAFTNRIRCSCCGDTYRRVKANGTNKNTTWRCKTHMRKASSCNNRILQEKVLQEAVLQALKILNQQDPTIPVVEEYQEKTMNRILGQIEVGIDYLKIQFIGENEVQVS